MAGLHVAVALFDESRRILLVRQEYGHRLWSLPGGAVERQESPVAAAVRETAEETGLAVEISGLIGIYAAPERDMLSLLFRGEVVESGTWQPTSEIAEIGFFAMDQLPEPMSDRMHQRIDDAGSDRRGAYRDGTVPFQNDDLAQVLGCGRELCDGVEPRHARPVLGEGDERQAS